MFLFSYSTAVASLSLAVACAPPSAQPVASAGMAPASDSVTSVVARPHRNPNVIAIEELQDPSIVSRDALSAIRQLRPAFFTSRGPVSFRKPSAGQLQITQDFGPLQPWAALGTIDTRSLVEVRYLNAIDATSRFGINANGGPVLVLLTAKE